MEYVPVFNQSTYVLYVYTPFTITNDSQGNITFVSVWEKFFGKTRLNARD